MLGTNDSAEHKTDPKEIVQVIAEYLKPIIKIQKMKYFTLADKIISCKKYIINLIV